MTGVRKSLEAAGLGRIGPYVEAHAKPSVRLAATLQREVAASRLGGRPNLPPELDWPEWNGLPLAFLAQIDLTRLPPIPGYDLPREGSLFFFHVGGADAPWGYDPKDRGSARVLYSPKRLNASRLRPPPEDLEDDQRYRAVRLEIEKVEHTIPDLCDQVIEELELSYEERCRYDQAWDRFNRGRPDLRHRMGGYPDRLQGDLRLQAQLVTHGLHCGNSSGYATGREKRLYPGAKDWELLLQIDSDDSAGMMWGDSGRIYFLIQKDDLRERRFENIWAILECM